MSDPWADLTPAQRQQIRDGHASTKEQCGAVGPKRTLYGRRVNLSCSLRPGHTGDHCDQAITGYSAGNWWPR